MHLNAHVKWTTARVTQQERLKRCFQILLPPIQPFSLCVSCERNAVLVVGLDVR